MTTRRRWLFRGLTLGATALLAPCLLAEEAAAPRLPPPPAQGRARYAVDKGGLALGEAQLHWQRQDNRYEVRLTTRTTGVTALLVPFTETRISRGEVTPQGWWVPVEVRRELPERPAEELVRSGEEVIVTRKGKTYRYPAAENAQDLLSLLFSLPEQVMRGRASGVATLLGTKGAKVISYRLEEEKLLPESAGQPAAVAIHAQTAQGQWQVSLWWARTPPARLVQLQVIGEEGAFTYRLLP